MQFTLTDAPEDNVLKAIADGLTAFNDQDVGPSGRHLLVITITDDAGTMTGGLSGYTAWGWLYVQWLWLDAPLRGQGLAGRLLQMAEDEATRRGCHGAFIDTFNPLALKAYRRQGYEVFGELADFPPGRTRSFLRKPLPAA
jgi:GNAT superfamily N-acetyltransferase